MNIYLRSCVTLIIAALICGVSLDVSKAYAEDGSEHEVTGFASVAFNSHYIWRGQKLSEKSVIQPTVGISCNGWAANIWMNTDLHTKETSETDLTLSYSTTASSVSLDFGYINYALDGAADTHEFFVIAGFDAILNPAIEFYYDVDEGEGGFVVASIGHSVEICDDISLDIGVAASANLENTVMGTVKGSNGVDKDFSGLYHGDLSVSLSLPACGNISITPSAGYTLALSDDAKEAIEGISTDSDNENFYGGVTLSFDF